MDLNIAQALHRNNESFQFESEEKFEDFSYLGRDIAFSKPVKLVGEFSYDGSSLNITGRLETEFHSVCAKCNEPFLESFGIDFQESFLNGALNTQDSDDADEVYVFTGEFVNLDKSITDNILLNLPIVSYCREDCKGICVKCGTNLNNGTCSCKTEKINSAFSALLDFKNDMNE